MTIVITVRADNSAFDDFDPLEGEVARVLKEAADLLMRGRARGLEGEIPLLDINGNRCGEIRWMESDREPAPDALAVRVDRRVPRAEIEGIIADIGDIGDAIIGRGETVEGGDSIEEALSRVQSTLRDWIAPGTEGNIRARGGAATS